MGLRLVTAARSTAAIISSNIEETSYAGRFASKENILHLESSILIVNNSNFAGNKKSYYSHVIFLDDESDGLIYNSIFLNNELSSCIHVKGNAKIRNTTFIGNGNFAPKNTQYSIIFSCTNGVMSIKNVTVLNNTALLMLLKTCDTDISSSYFNKNNFKSYRRTESHETRTLINITDCVFKENEVIKIINMGGNSETFITNTVFENNTVDKRAISSSCVSVRTGTMRLKNTIFVANRLRGDAGIVNCVGVMSVENVTMLNNEGETIHAFDCNMTVSNSIFVNNSAAKYHDCNSIVKNSNVTILDSTFQNNNAPFGGCVCVSNEYSTIIDIKRSKFSSNLALQHGGVLFLDYVPWVYSYIPPPLFRKKRTTFPIQSIRFSDCSFTNNHANIMGGVTAMVRAEVMFSICTVIQNTAGKSGGALFLENCRTTLNFVNLTDNHALADGGGIVVNSSPSNSFRIYSNIKLYNVNATGNSAGNTGGFLKVDKKCNFEGKVLNLTNNSAEIAGNDVMLDSRSTGTMEFVLFSNISENHPCSLAVHGHSHLTLEQIYSHHQTKIPQSDDCLRDRSYISNLTVGKQLILF